MVGKLLARSLGLMLFTLAVVQFAISHYWSQSTSGRTSPAVTALIPLEQKVLYQSRCNFREETRAHNERVNRILCLKLSPKERSQRECSFRSVDHKLQEVVARGGYRGIVVAGTLDTRSWRGQWGRAVLERLARRGFLGVFHDPGQTSDVDRLQDHLYSARDVVSLVRVLRNRRALCLALGPADARLFRHFRSCFTWLDISMDPQRDPCYSAVYLDELEALRKMAHFVTAPDRGFHEKHLAGLEFDEVRYLRRNNAAVFSDDALSAMEELPSFWTVGANAISAGVSLYTVQYYRFHGWENYMGGAERYYVDLYRMFRDAAVPMVVYQCGTHAWARKSKGMWVLSLNRGDPQTTCEEQKHVFYDLVNGVSHLNIYSAFFDAPVLSASPSIGISHGVVWDNDMNTKIFMENYVTPAVKALDHIVSVDTNTLNHLQSLDYKKSYGFDFIPNYADLDEFHPPAGFKAKLESSDKVRICYPRRLYNPRGLGLVLDVLEDLLETYDNFEFCFLGRGDPPDTDKVAALVKKHSTRVFWHAADMQDMPMWYRRMDVTLVPTLYSEGTSLSLIEAMSTGNMIIATRVGGLSDLVLDSFNGLLISPRSSSLRHALVRAITDAKERNMLRRNALATAKVFSKRKWRERWERSVTRLLKRMGRPGLRPPRHSAHLCLVGIYVSGPALLESPKRLGRFIMDLLTTQSIMVFLGYDAILLPKKFGGLSAKVISRKMSFERLQFMTRRYFNTTDIDAPDVAIQHSTFRPPRAASTTFEYESLSTLPSAKAVIKACASL